MSKQTSERSRAYPALSLEDSGRLIGEILERLGTGTFSREVLAEILGYSNAHGGPGARKIAALTQYGFLKRRAGLYSPTALAESLRRSPDAPERLAVLRQALRRPPLFKALLERYAPQGRVPSQLASILWREYGITRKASHLAADIFGRSARYTGVLDEDGVFLHRRGLEQPGVSRPAGIAREPSAITEQKFEFALTEGKLAKLSLPLRLHKKDLEIVRRQIEFLDYQVAGEDGDHE